MRRPANVRAASRLRHLALLGPPGAGSMAFARSIHKHTRGPPWPLVIAREFHPDKAGPRARRRIRENQAEQKQMLTAAGHGTLVLSFDDLAADLCFLIDSTKSRAFGIRAIFLGNDDARLGVLGALASETVVIRVPALASRRHELSPIVTDVVNEHAGTQGASAALFTAHDYQSLLAYIRTAY